MKPTVIFIHGYMNTGQVWQEWQSEFEQAGYQTLAPSWPYLLGEVATIRKHPNPQLGQLTFDDVVEHYRQIIARLPQKPVLIGHSIGGVVVQELVSEGLAQAAVCINSGPPKGIVALNWDFLISNLQLVQPWNRKDQLVLMGPNWYHHYVTNDLSLAATRTFIDRNCVPASRLIPTTIPQIDFAQVTTPIFFIAGGNDKSQPPVVNRKNFNAYTNPAIKKRLTVYPGRTHNTLAQPGWQNLAGDIMDWLSEITQ